MSRWNVLRELIYWNNNQASWWKWKGSLSIHHGTYVWNVVNPSNPSRIACVPLEHAGEQTIIPDTTSNATRHQTASKGRNTPVVSKDWKRSKMRRQNERFISVSIPCWWWICNNEYRYRCPWASIKWRSKTSNWNWASGICREPGTNKSWSTGCKSGWRSNPRTRADPTN